MTLLQKKLSNGIPSYRLIIIRQPLGRAREANPMPQRCDLKRPQTTIENDEYPDKLRILSFFYVFLLGKLDTFCIDILHSRY
jgi:hypothetical protein